MARSELSSHRGQRPTRATSEHISSVMKSNRSRGTFPERLMAKELRRLGLTNFATNVASLPGKPDLVFPLERAAVFVYGCFWHRCDRCGIRLPRTHQDYWRRKLEGNRRRDRRVREALRREGWRVLTVWECALQSRPDTS